MALLKMKESAKTRRSRACTMINLKLAAENGCSVGMNLFPCWSEGL